MDKPIRAVEFRAEILQIKTKVDHTVNIILNIPEYNIAQVKVMLDFIGKDLRVLIEDDKNG